MEDMPMKLLNTLITLFVLMLAAIVLLPVIGVGLALIVTGGVFIIWLLPILLIMGSDQATRLEKLCWILAIIFLSWFAWILYAILGPLVPRREYRYRSDYYY